MSMILLKSTVYLSELRRCLPKNKLQDGVGGRSYVVGGEKLRYQFPLSSFYSPVSAFLLVLEKMAGVEGLEPPTHGLEIRGRGYLGS